MQTAVVTGATGILDREIVPASGRDKQWTKIHALPEVRKRNIPPQSNRIMPTWRLLRKNYQTTQIPNVTGDASSEYRLGTPRRKLPRFLENFPFNQSLQEPCFKTSSEPCLLIISRLNASSSSPAQNNTAFISTPWRAPCTKPIPCALPTSATRSNASSTSCCREEALRMGRNVSERRHRHRERKLYEHEHRAGDLYGSE